MPNVAGRSAHALLFVSALALGASGAACSRSGLFGEELSNEPSGAPGGGGFGGEGGSGGIPTTTGSGGIGGTTFTGGGGIGGTTFTGGGGIGGTTVTGGGGIGGTTVTGGGGIGGTTGTGGMTVTTSTTITGGPCNTPQDCNDGDLCTTDECKEGLCIHGPKDDDKDGWAPVSCGGLDCNDLNPQVFPGAAEICTDAADNNCNGVADCVDPACVNAPLCGCQPAPGGESCTNGTDDDCDQIVDCFDADCAGTEACGCAPTEAGNCTNGFDDDCDGAFDCDDSSCFADMACTCQAQGESCGDDVDNDCDLLVDCTDPDCFGLFPCACVPPGVPEQCGDGSDNDCDKLADCADPDCFVSPLCSMCTTESCNDGIDNSCDGKIDCADPACAFAPNCAIVPEICNNSLDDDKDGKIDCQDPDCANNPFCVLQQANCLSPKLIPGSGTYTGDTTGHISETKGVCGGDAGEAVFFFTLTDPSFVHIDSIGTTFDSTLYVRTGVCNTGKEIGCDDDSAGVMWSAQLEFTLLLPGTYFVFLDGYTVDPQGGPNEGPFTLNVVIQPNPVEICNDHKDNDGDIHADCADSDCWGTPPCDTCLNGSHGEPEFGVGKCTDGLDNDCDGTNDCQDDDCSASDFYITECCDGTDENGNGIPDDFNCRCQTNADCSGGQICYTHTAFACGIPCNFFFGDVCPFVAAGSFCNAVTQQCEF